MNKGWTHVHLQCFAQLSWIRAEHNVGENFYTLNGRCMWMLLLLLLGISEMLWGVAMKVIYDRPCWTRWIITVISTRAKKRCIFKSSSEVWHIKDLKWLKLCEDSVKWMNVFYYSSQGSHLQNCMTIILTWSICLSNLLTGMYWHELSALPLPIVSSELFLLLMRNFLWILIYLYYVF
jgi:hypothetical protein